MSELMSAPTVQSVDSPHPDMILQGSDWLRSLSFGEALRQSIILLQREFRWLVLLFFLGGTGLSLILLPVNLTIEHLATLLIQEMMSFPPNFDMLVNYMTASLIWGALQTFITFFVIFLLNAITIHRVFKKRQTLEAMKENYHAPHFSSLHIIVAGLITAGLLALANLFVIAVPLVLVFCFFVPAILVIEGGSVKHAFTQSFGMRRQHWQKIFGAILLGATFLVFTHTIGVHVYLSLEFLLQLYGLSLGIGASVLLIILTQIPVSMVAPLIPLLSVAFYSGARGAMAEYKYERFTRAVQRQRARVSTLIPFDQNEQACQRCGSPLRPSSAYCTRCGTSTTPPPSVASSKTE